MNNTMNPQTVEIDVVLLLKKIWSRKFLILFFASLFAATSMMVNLFLITPLYTATTSIYVVNNRSTSDGLSTQDLVAGTYLVRDYKEIITSKDVRVTVSDQLGDVVSAASLSGKLSVTIPTDTRMIYISIKDENPETAALIANTVRDVAAEKIKQVTKVEEVNVVEAADVPLSASSPRVSRNVMLGGLVGAFLAIVGIFLKEVLDDRVKRPEDIEETLGVTLLGVVPKIGQLK